jgi:peptidyl-prolyl cis-trans isomerase SurA
MAETDRRSSKYKTLHCAIAMVVVLSSATAATAQTMFRPVAVVNDSAITGFDLSQRAQIMVALGFKPNSQQELQAAALDRLIEDRLKMQEGARAGLKASTESLDEGISEIAKKVGLSVDEFFAAMAAKGISEQALKDMVGAEIVWRQVIRGQFSRRVEPGEAEIDAEISLLQARSGVSYRIAEIGLPASDAGRSPDETRALADKVYASLAAGGDFNAAVRTYSRAPSAANGGEIGWVANDRLPPELAEVMGGLAVGDVTTRFVVPGGFSILKLLETRVASTNAADNVDQELRTKIRNRLTNQRTARLAEGLLQELRRDASIEMR